MLTIVAVCRFGENLDQGVLSRAQQAVDDADLFITVGTSSVVYPAAGFVSRVIPRPYSKLQSQCYKLMRVCCLPGLVDWLLRTSRRELLHICVIVSCMRWSGPRPCVLQVAMRGIPCAEVNLETSGATGLCKYTFQGRAGEILPGLLEVPTA